jgi:hypothetical protein
MSSPLDRLRTVVGFGLEEIPGATLQTEIPVPDAVLNRLIAQALAGRESVVSAVEIETGEGDRFAAHVIVRGPRLIPQLKVHAEIERQPEFPGLPVLVIRWSLPNLGPLAMMAAPFLANLKGLPRGIAIDGERAFINVAELLETRGLGDLLPLLRRLELHTTPEHAVLRLEMRT